MTQKELLYVEDAIGHEKNIISIVKDTIERLQNENLISFFEQELQKHEQMQQKLLNTLEEYANE